MLQKKPMRLKLTEMIERKLDPGCIVVDLPVLPESLLSTSSSCKSSRAFGSRNKAVMESSLSTSYPSQKLWPSHFI
jgi:hypothetical protein